MAPGRDVYDDGKVRDYKFDYSRALFFESLRVASSLSFPTDFSMSNFTDKSWKVQIAVYINSYLSRVPTFG